MNSSFDISESLPLTLFFSLSNFNPKNSKPFKHSSLVSGEFSPTPAVNNITSALDIFYFSSYSIMEYI